MDSFALLLLCFRQVWDAAASLSVLEMSWRSLSTLQVWKSFTSTVTSAEKRADGYFGAFIWISPSMMCTTTTQAALVQWEAPPVSWSHDCQVCKAQVDVDSNEQGHMQARLKRAQCLPRGSAVIRSSCKRSSTLVEAVSLFGMSDALLLLSFPFFFVIIIREK